MFATHRLPGHLCLLGLAIVAVGCSRQPPLAKAPPVEVVVCQPLKAPVEDWDVFTGTVEAKDAVKVRARVRGHITKVLFEEGEDIKAGADLYEIDSDPFVSDKEQAEGQLALWKTKLELAEARIKLYTPLAGKGTVSKEELLKAKADKGEALGSMQTARGKIKEADTNMKYCKIKAPVAGRVGEALLKLGDLVNSSGADSLLTTVVPLDPMYVNFYVNERALLNYQELLRKKAKKDPGADNGEKPKVPVKLALLGQTTFNYSGLVDFADNRLDPKTGSVKVRAKFANPKGLAGQRALSAGLFARVKVSTSDPYPAILVADRAILTDQSLKYVLVVNKAKDNLVERVDVVVAKRLQDNGLRAVEAGLKGDEWIIVEGVNRARAGITVSPKEKEMPKRPVSGK